MEYDPPGMASPFTDDDSPRAELSLRTGGLCETLVTLTFGNDEDAHKMFRSSLMDIT